MNERRSPLLAFTAFEQALLRSAEADEAPRGAAERALLALGAGASHAAVSLHAGSAAGAAVPSPNPAWSLWQKPLLIGVLGGVSVALSARVVDGPSERDAPRAAVTRTLASSAPAAPPLTASASRTPAPQAIEAPASPKRRLPGAAPAPALPAASAAREATVPLVLPPLPPVPAGTSTSSPPTLTDTNADVAATARSSSIAAEVIVVDRARLALRDGRVRDALAELARYRERWPLGVLTPEVTVLQIEAELASGARESARRRAKALIIAQPSSRYAARLRVLFEPRELQ